MASGPEDCLNIDDFYKVYGYACFYKADTGAINDIPAEELTITLVGRRYPGKLIKYLEMSAGYTVNNVDKGIYYVEGDRIPIQIVVTSRLSKGENLWLSSLTNDLQERETVDDLLMEFEKHREDSRYISVMDMILHANKEIFTEVRGVYGFIRELFEDEIAEAEAKTWDKAWGEAQGETENCFGLLINKLLEDSRTEDLRRAANDKEFRKKLCKEYKIEIREAAEARTACEDLRR